MVEITDLTMKNAIIYNLPGKIHVIICIKDYKEDGVFI